MGASAVVEGLTSTYRDAAALETRIVEGTLRCIARWGVSKTTLDDIARESGCSRATVYRTFPGGKDKLLEGVARHELGRFFHLVAEPLDHAGDLEQLLVTGIGSAMRFLDEHDALRYLLVHEPHVVLPHVAFHRLDKLLAHTTAVCVPYLERFLPPERAAFAADLAVRLVLSYSFDPSPAVDPRDDASIRRLVRLFVLPGLTADVP